jgi:hypothetical protein
LSTSPTLFGVEGHQAAVQFVDVLGPADERGVDQIGVARRERQRPLVVGRAQRQGQLAVGQVDALLGGQPESPARRMGDPDLHLARRDRHHLGLEVAVVEQHALAERQSGQRRGQGAADRWHPVGDRRALGHHREALSDRDLEARAQGRHVDDRELGVDAVNAGHAHLRPGRDVGGGVDLAATVGVAALHHPHHSALAAGVAHGELVTGGERGPDRGRHRQPVGGRGADGRGMQRDHAWRHHPTQRVFRRLPLHDSGAGGQHDRAQLRPGQIDRDLQRHLARRRRRPGGGDDPRPRLLVLMGGIDAQQVHAGVEQPTAPAVVDLVGRRRGHHHVDVAAGRARPEERLGMRVQQALGLVPARRVVGEVLAGTVARRRQRVVEPLADLGDRVDDVALEAAQRRQTVAEQAELERPQIVLTDADVVREVASARAIPWSDPGPRGPRPGRWRRAVRAPGPRSTRAARPGWSW